MVGAILAPGQRTVTAAWRVRGLAPAQSFQAEQRVLHRAVWTSVKGSCLPLGPAADPWAPAGPRGRGSDDTRERRRGPAIRAKGMARDPVRSAHSQVVNGRRWRWWSLLRLGPMPRGPRFWALPGVPGLAPSERYPRDRGQQHQKLPAGARQRRLGIRRWGPARHLVLVPEPRCAVITGRWRLRRWAPPRGGITRVRGAAARSAPAPPHQPRPHGRPRLTGERQPTLAPVLRQPAPDCTTGTGRGW